MCVLPACMSMPPHMFTQHYWRPEEALGPLILECLCTQVFCLDVRPCTTYVCTVPLEAKENVGSPATGVTGSVSCHVGGRTHQAVDPLQEYESFNC